MSNNAKEIDLEQAADGRLRLVLQPATPGKS